jgi:predicted aldo/keto reductase-like oxidoreductase
MDKWQQISRRQFIGRTAAGVVGVLGAPAVAAAAPTVRRSAADRVVLGRSGIGVSRLGLGTGSNGGSVQRGVGQEQFTRLVRHALDRGITFFDTADNYGEMHEALREALRGVPREGIQIQTKIPWERNPDALRELDRFRREVGTEYFDSVLIHCTRTARWPTELARMMDQLAEAKQRGLIRSHGVSMHGLEPLEATVRTRWPDVAQVRVNHNGHHMDGPTGEWKEPGNRDAALPHIRRLHAGGKGVIGMKLIGNGDFTDPEVRRRSIHSVMRMPFVDAVVIGFKSPAEIDEAIRNMNEGLSL